MKRAHDDAIGRRAAHRETALGHLAQTQRVGRSRYDWIRNGAPETTRTVTLLSRVSPPRSKP
jgi:hypothetical protein